MKYSTEEVGPYGTGECISKEDLTHTKKDLN